MANKLEERQDAPGLSESHMVFKDSTARIDSLMQEINLAVDSKGGKEAVELICETYAPLMAQCLKESMEILEKWVVSMQVLPTNRNQGMLF